MDLIALILFIVVIAVSFLKKTNAGILAFAIGAIAVRIFSLTDKDLIGAISTSMFSILVGITLLFVAINSTGALELLAKKDCCISRRSRLDHSNCYLRCWFYYCWHWTWCDSCAGDYPRISGFCGCSSWI